MAYDQRDQQQNDRDLKQDQRDARLEKREDSASESHRDQRDDIDLRERLSAQSARIDALERWQTQQNGSLRRLEEKADTAAQKSDVVRMEETHMTAVNRVSDKLDHLLYWILGAAFTLLMALAGVFLRLKA